ncbi:MAG: ribosome biogenesis GTPase YlqF [Firmicutes bacterium]|nr:ribosome biogenesis GTPase YlqF [Bacillota bacterium]
MTVINWFPGHMAKAGRQVKEQAALCDLILEIADARLPRSSRNPQSKQYTGKKPTVLVLNKADLTDKHEQEKWLAHFKEQGQPAVFVAARKKQGFKELNQFLDAEYQKLTDYLTSRGRRPRPLRIMMVGIPNTGKSALLNAMVGENKVKTGNKPGLTRSVQWIRTAEHLELLDSPGILWPKLEDQEAALALAAVGSISKDACPEEECGWFLLNWLIKNRPQVFEERYKVNVDDIPEYPEELLEMVARNRGMVRKGGIREEETYIMLLKEFRDGKMGKFMLEMPE